MVDDADVVVVHEWNEPWLVAKLGRLRARGGRFTLLFHDTHHRAVSAPEEMKAYDLSAYDGVLAFGEALAEVYRRWGWGGRVFLWHEAGSLRHFHPPAEEGERRGLAWIGKWGDGERTKELKEYLFRPARAAGLALDVWGVRYHETAKATFRRYGGRYHGWLANAEGRRREGPTSSTCCGRAGTLSARGPTLRRGIVPAIWVRPEDHLAVPVRKGCVIHQPHGNVVIEGSWRPGQAAILSP